MPTVHLTLQQLQEAIEGLTPEEFSQLNQLLERKRRTRLAEILNKARRNAAGVSSEEAARIVQEAIEEVRAEYAANRGA